MEILFCRHGIAEDQGPDGSDASRRLTEEGLQRTTQVARGLARIVEPPDLILTSPKTRAKQTAQIIGSVFQVAPRTINALGSGSVQDILNDVARRPQERIVLVGHEPTLSQVMVLCLTGLDPERYDLASFVQLKKAGVGCIQIAFNPDHSVLHAELLWLATPKMLRSIGDGKGKHEEE